MRCSVRECLLDTYEAFDCQTSATDAAGVTTFTYDPYGQLISEQVSGLYSKTLTRHYDLFGRTVGYSVDGERKQTNLKSSLTYPNEAVVTWSYEPHRDLLTAVTNATYSTYVYTNDLLGRRTSKNDEQYGYNVRDELISANDTSYAYDDIGNRTIAEGKTYTANNLNQYTAIDDFTPQYDADGNQTLIKTPTGIWSVTYNAENRPVRWTRGDTIVTMTFDRLGRRVDYYETRAGQVATHFRFVYDNFLCVQRLNAANGNAVRTEFVWDPTEPIATRPLIMRAKNWGLNLFYTHDGNKNVSEVFYHALQNGIAAHYDYAPFGTVTRTARATRVTNRDILSENPFRFSSEYHDFTLDLVYYNYRYYNSMYGRWENRDPFGSINLFLFCLNSPEYNYDWLGLEVIFYGGDVLKAIEYLLNNAKAVTGENALALPIPKVEVISQTIDAVCDENCHPEGIRYIATVTIKPKSDVSPASVVMPKWKSSSASEAERELFRQVYKLVLEHEQEHVRIWNKYMNKLFVEYTDSYESCSKHGILDLAKSNAKEKTDNGLQTPFRAIYERKQ